MKELREIIQSKLEEIEDLEVVSEIADDVLQKNITYFSYTLQKTYLGSDLGQKYSYRINLLGYLKRLQNNEENTLEIIDDMTDKIEKKLKELNFKSNFIDVTITDGVRKKQVNAFVDYNEINNGLA